MLKNLLYKIKSYAAGIPESRLLIILALVVGLGSGSAAVLLKQMVHFFEWILTGWFNTPADSLLFLLYPGLGMLLAFLFVKYIVKDNIGMVDMFIVQELSKDVDGGGASIYWVKEKGGKLKFTAPWDYDFSMGSYGVSIKTTQFVCEIIATDLNTGNKPNLWLQSLAKQEWFLKRLYARMAEVDEMVSFALRAVQMQGEVLTPAADRNDARWHIYGRKFQYYLHRQVSKDLNSYQDHIDFLCNWIEIRWNWMKNEVESRLAG